MSNPQQVQNNQDSSTPLISIIIISYNTREMTLECLHSVVKETTNLNYELIVVDNDSKDGSAEAIAEQFPNIKLIARKDNLGFAKANNLASEDAKGEYLLLLNPDTIVLDRAIEKLHDFSQKHPDAGIWGGRTYYGDRSLNPYSCWRRMTPWNVFCRISGLAAILPQSSIFNSEAYGGWNRDTVRQVDIVTGCFLLITKKLWKDLKGFDPLFFMYGEEADLCLRAKKMGYKPIVTPEAGIVHYGGASDSVKADKMVKLLKGKIALLKRHWSPLTRWIGQTLYLMWPIRQLIAHNTIAKLRPGKEWNSEQAQAWKEVWQRRSEWSKGY